MEETQSAQWIVWAVTQGGIAITAVILAVAVRTLWARTSKLEDEKADLLKQQVADARKDAEEAMKIQAQIVQEQTKTRELMERLSRKLERGNGS